MKEFLVSARERSYHIVIYNGRASATLQNQSGRLQHGSAAHVAAATVARADAIVSWNFKHIVRIDKMRSYNQVNLQTGFGLLSIVSPQEVRLDEAT